MVLFDLEDDDAAGHNFEQCALYTNQDPASLSALGNAWACLHNFDKAELFYSRSLVIDPENAEVWNMRGHALRDAGEHNRAVPCFERALELDPEDGDSYMSRESCIRIMNGEEEPLILTIKNHDSITKDNEY